MSIRGVRLSWLLAALAACGEATDPRVEIDGLAAARARWGERGPSDYTFTLTRSCFCLPEWTGPVTVLVKGTVASRAYTETGEPVPAHLWEAFPDIPGLFHVVEQASAAGADLLEIVYDRELGYPRRIGIDYSFGWADDEVGYLISDLKRF